MICEILVNTQAHNSGVARIPNWGPGVSRPPLSLPSLSLPPFPPLLFPSLPLVVGPLKYSYEICGSAVSSPSGVWGRALAEIDFGAFWP